MEKLLNLIMNRKKEDTTKGLTKEIIDIIKSTPNDQELGEKLRTMYLNTKENKK